MPIPGPLPMVVMADFLGKDECRREAAGEMEGGVQQPPTAAEPPYDGGRRHDQVSAPNLPPQLTLGVPLKAPPAHGPW
eukprot:COSAG01_NODE_30912_length_607_cov_1.094488_1_plen_77_part_10